MSARADIVRSFYRAIDEKRYDDLTDLLAPEFMHQRPDRALGGREAFVEFMREKRPLTDTAHEIDGVYENDGEDGGEVAVRGRLLDGDERLFGFVDVHSIEDGVVTRVRTYTD